MRGCQHYGLFVGTLNIRCRIILMTQKGTVILTTIRITPQGPTWCENRCFAFAGLPLSSEKNDEAIIAEAPRGH